MEAPVGGGQGSRQQWRRVTDGSQGRERLLVDSSGNSSARLSGGVIVEEGVVRMAGFSILEVVAIPVTLITTEEVLLHQENSSPKPLEVKEMVQLCSMR
jgi:hypothetical protein